MHTRSTTLRSQAFTIVELIIVVAVIGILATVSIVGYGAIQANARDKAVLSDIEGVASEVTRYSVKNNGTYGSAIVWYSPSGMNPNINFTPSSGNVIDVSVNSIDYCIRAYNSSSLNYTSLGTAATKESSAGACSRVAPSSEAIAANPQVNGAVVTTLAGSNSGYVDATGTAAKFSGPYDIDDGPDGNLYITDYSNNRIRKITPAGVVTTIAGSGTAGYADGTGVAASFRQPIGIAVDSLNNIFVGDSNNHVVRKITPAGVVTTFAGTPGIYGSTNGTGSGAKFAFLHDLAIDSSDNIYVADQFNRLIRKITPAGVVTTLAGNGVATYADGTSLTASFTSPIFLTVDINNNVYVSDSDRLRKITPAGIVTTLAGDGTAGFANGVGTAARFNGLYGITVDYAGNIYASDSGNVRIRKITPSGAVTTFAGNGIVSSIDGTATGASFHYPYGLVMTPSGTIFVLDNLSSRVRRIQ